MKELLKASCNKDPALASGGSEGDAFVATLHTLPVKLFRLGGASCRTKSKSKDSSDSMKMALTC